MQKGFLIGVSIIAVVLLVLNSLTNVVGYQSMKSSVINDSPLFQIRTQRAINPQQNIFTSNYLGKGKENELKVFIPRSSNERILLQKALKRIQGMDNATFTKFVEQVLIWVSTQDEYKDVNVPQLIIILYQIKENPTTFEQYLVHVHNDLLANGDITINRWFPGCLIFCLLSLITDVLLSSIFFIWILFFSSRVDTCLAYVTCNPRECW